jgi:hypothetical protein
MDRPLISALALVAVLLAPAMAAEERPERAIDNAALVYWMAFSFIPQPDSEAGRELARFSEGKEPDVKRAGTGIAALRLLRKGAARPFCDWGQDYTEDGHGILLPYLGQQRTLVDYIALMAYGQAHWKQYNNACDTLLAALRFTRHLQNRRASLTEFLVGTTCERKVYAQMAALIPELDLEGRQNLEVRLAAVPDPEPLSAPLETEKLMVMWVQRKLSTSEDPKRLLDDMLGSPKELLDLSPADISAQLEMTLQVFAELHRALSLPIENFTPIAEDLNRRIESKPLVRMWMPAFEMIKSNDEKKRMQLRLLRTVLRAQAWTPEDPAFSGMEGLRFEGKEPTLDVSQVRNLGPGKEISVKLELGRRWKDTKPKADS